MPPRRTNVYGYKIFHIGVYYELAKEPFVQSRLSAQQIDDVKLSVAFCGHMTLNNEVARLLCDVRHPYKKRPKRTNDFDSNRWKKVVQRDSPQVNA